MHSSVQWRASGRSAAEARRGAPGGIPTRRGLLRKLLVALALSAALALPSTAAFAAGGGGGGGGCTYQGCHGGGGGGGSTGGGGGCINFENVISLCGGHGH